MLFTTDIAPIQFQIEDDIFSIRIFTHIWLSNHLQKIEKQDSKVKMSYIHTLTVKEIMNLGKTSNLLCTNYYS